MAIEAGRVALKRPESFALVASVREHRDDPARAVKTAIEALEPLQATRYDRWPQRQGDLELLGRLARRHRSLEAYLDTYTLDPLVTEHLKAQDEDDRVTISTVHSAKGTEAKVVYVAAASGRNYPHLKSRGDPAAVEEERRVLYVALTRAKDELIISRAVEADRGWATSDGSSFLDGLPADLVTEYQFVTSGWALDDESPTDRQAQGLTLPVASVSR